MTNVVTLEVLQGDGFHIAADEVLDRAKGLLVRCVVVGVDHDGGLFMADTDGCAESVFLMERAKAAFIESDFARNP